MTSGNEGLKIHVGEIVKAEMQKQGMTNSVFASRIHTSRSYISRLLKNRTWTLSLMKEASEVLGRDFFKELLLAKTKVEMENDKMKITELEEQINKRNLRIEEMENEIEGLRVVIKQKDESIALLKETIGIKN